MRGNHYGHFQAMSIFDSTGDLVEGAGNIVDDAVDAVGNAIDDLIE